MQVHTKMLMTPALRDELVALIDEWKRSEIIQDPQEQQGWSEKRAHLRVVAKQIARKEGFQITSKGYRVAMPGGFELDVEVDVGHPGSTVPQVAVLNRLMSADRGWTMPRAWGKTLPGLGFYDHGKDSAALVWGIKAFVVAGREFGATLEL
jgi:hypothetical protein